MNLDVNSLSLRGQKATQTVLRIDMDLYFEALDNLYHKKKNPNGAFPLNMAENKLSWDLLRNKIQKIVRNNDIPEWVAGYTASIGHINFRTALAAFLSKFLTDCPISPENLACSAGSASVIEVTSWVLADKGDVMVIPAPSYPVYTQDIGIKAGIERYDLVTHHELSELQNGSPLSIQHLEQAKRNIEEQGKRFKILTITSPDNPTGLIYSKSHLLKIADWCISNKIHLIVNEIYGLSIIDTNHPLIREDYKQEVCFESFASIINEKNSDYLHLWYAISKDFGASGFRVGTAYSLNPSFIRAFDNVNAPHMVSNFTQWVFQKIFEDFSFLEKYITHNQKELTENYVTVVHYLKKYKINYSPSRGSLFIWIDLSQFTKEDSSDAAFELWETLYRKTGVLLTPESGFGHSKNGQFRIVFAFLKRADLEIAMQKMCNYLMSIKLVIQ